jgi:TonB family protein
MSFLIESGLRMSVVLITALLACATIKARPAALKHWVLAVAVACAWAMPLLSRVVPEWWSVPAWSERLPGARDVSQSSMPRPVEPSRELDASVRSELSISEPQHSPFASFSVMQIMWTIWLLGTLINVLVLVAGLGRLRWLARRAQPVETGRWLDLAETLRQSYRLSSPVRLFQSNHPSLLVTWGWHRPTVLLPACAREWSDERIRIVLAHEFAHVSRGDWIVQLGAETLRSAFWCNPLVWIACRRLRTESEYACDDAVMARGVAGAEYAAHLLALARSLNPGLRPWLPAPAMARPSSLEGRVRAMLSNVVNRDPVSRSVRIVTALALVALTVPIAGLWAQARFYSFSGSVLDPTNRLLPDATLVLTNPTSKAKYEIHANDAGRFEFVGLPPGQYRLEVSRPGFATLVENVAIAAPLSRELRLRVGSLEETITVKDSAPPPSARDAATVTQVTEARRRLLAENVRAKCAAGAPGLIGGEILPPAKLLDVRPVYPAHLRAAKVGGVVTMAARIATDGTVLEVRQVKGPHPDLEAAAAEAVRQWQFSTTFLNCEPIEVEMKVTTNFAVEP